MRHRIARAAIVIYFVTFLASCLVMCSCPGFFWVMAICAVVALICGSRLQRLLSVGLFFAAIGGFICELRAEQRVAEQVRQIKERVRQQNLNQ